MRGRLDILLWGLLLLAGCTGRPPIPVLNRIAPPPPASIVLTDRLTPEDIRSLFRSINQDGKLDGLKPYLESPPDSELQRVTELFSRYFYQEAFQTDGLLNTLRQGIRNRDFSRFAKWAETWSAEPSYSLQIGAWRDLFAQSDFPQLLSYDSGLLAPAWSTAAVKVHTEANENYVEPNSFAPSPFPQAWSLVADLAHLTGDATLSQSLAATAGDLDSDGFGASALDALAVLRSQHESAGGSGSEAFAGFGHGIASLLAHQAPEPVYRAKNQLQTLLEFVHTADGPTGGLFSQVQKQLHDEPSLANMFSQNFQPIVTDAIAGFLVDNLNGPRTTGGKFDKAFWLGLAKEPANAPPSPAFQDLFIAVTMAIEQVTGWVQADGSPSDDDTVDNNGLPLTLNTFHFNQPIYLDALVLTRWLKQQVRDGQSLFEALDDSQYPQAIWSLSLTPTPFITDLLVMKDKKAVVADDTKQTLVSLRLPNFENRLESVVEAQDVPTYEYSILPNHGTLQSALKNAVVVCQTIRPMADPSSFIQGLFFKLSHPSDGGISLGSLESGNLMDQLNRLLAGFTTVASWDQVDHLLFQGMQIGGFDQRGQYNTGTRETILSFYARAPALQKRMGALLDSIQMLHQIDLPVAGLPPPLEVYHEVLYRTAPAHPHGVTALLDFLQKSGFFESTPGTVFGQPPKFPAIDAIVRGGSPLARSLYGLSSLDASEQTDFLAALHQLVGGSEGKGLALNLKVLGGWLARKGPGVTELATHIVDGQLENGDQDLFTRIDVFPAPYRAWLLRFISNGDHAKLWTHLNDYGDRQSLLALVRQLEALSRGGQLHEAFQLLSLVRDERMQQAAMTFQIWQDSGELGEFLIGVERLLDY